MLYMCFTCFMRHGFMASLAFPLHASRSSIDSQSEQQTRYAYYERLRHPIIRPIFRMDRASSR